MSEPPRRRLAIGWDVRGWRSSQQAVAVADLHRGGLRWRGLAPAFGFETGKPVDLGALTAPALGGDWQRVVGAAERVVVAIDSPLAFPSAFRRLMAGKGRPLPTAAEIDNPLAYRDCDRYVAAAYGKKPLSAAFDRLGNTATLAMVLCQSLRKIGYRVVPQDAGAAERAIIEVYPGIHKREAWRGSEAVESLARWIPESVTAGSDLYDACICAILALVFAGAGATLELPDLTSPDAALPQEEGWIFGLPPDWVAIGRDGPTEGLRKRPRN